jgi:hypothetical protein
MVLYRPSVTMLEQIAGEKAAGDAGLVDWFSAQARRLL